MSIGFYFDMTRCTGCRACQVACKDKNRLEVGNNYRVARTFSVGAFPSVAGYSVSTTCNHCTDAVCVANCPTGAMYKAEDGTVISDSEICIGCGTCVVFCPYEVPQILPAGVCGKCDSCFVIRGKGEQPACVSACPSRALDFGEVSELEAKYGADLVNAITVWPDGETNPNTRIKAKAAALEAGQKEVCW